MGNMDEWDRVWCELDSASVVRECNSLDLASNKSGVKLGLVDNCQWKMFYIICS